MLHLLLVLLSNYFIFMILPVFLYLFFFISQRLALRALLSASFAWAVAVIIKELFYFPRPYILSHRLPLAGIWLDGSFPSGHTALAFAFSFSVFLFRPRLGGWLLFISTIIAFSRVASAVHRPLDIAAGIIIAFAVALITKNITFFFLRLRH